jgi:20S proteasome alpha/beta subunit
VIGNILYRTKGNYPMTRHPFTALVCSLLVVMMPSPSHAAHSRRRVVIARERDTYDRVITDFSPDGRLLQVEYGMEAARRGSLIAAARSTVGICLVIHNSSFGKMHRIDHHIWLMTAGLSGDARFLATHLRKGCQQHRLNYGEAPTTEEVAKMAGDFQHYLTRAGGIRPLGCTGVVLGVDPVLDEDRLGIPRVFQTEPGGIVEACPLYCAIGQGSDVVSKDLASLKFDDAATLEQTALMMAQSVLGKIDNPKTVDVWMIEPRSGNRGGMQATCHRRITKDCTLMLSGLTPAST